MKFVPNLVFNTPKPLKAYTRESDGNAYPNTMDMRDLVLKTEDQGMTSMCAAYTATSWIEGILWRKTGKPVDFDPVMLYNEVKKFDGIPYDGGTTLDAVLIGMINLGWIKDHGKEDIKLFFTSNELKKAIHRYGTCLIGLNITEDWEKHDGKLVLEKANGKSLGGHAIICVGYNNVGVFIQNSWGFKWGKYGFACIAWDVFDKEFMCGAYIKNCLNNMED
jgi:C1A family cysteine protease